MVLREATVKCREVVGGGGVFVILLPLNTRLPSHCLVTTDEIDHANHFVRHEDRHAYLLGRHVIRTVVPEVGEDEPLCREAQGKPFLPGRPAFNLSHGGNHLALAVAAAGPIGVDVERVPAVEELGSLLETCCHPSELHWILSRPSHVRNRAFATCWTRKEAALKAWGFGLINELASLDTLLGHPSPIIHGSCPVRLWDLADTSADFACCVAASPGAPAPYVMYSS